MPDARSLRYGLFDQVEQPGDTPLHQVINEHLDLAVAAEAAGFERVLKSEHHHVPLDAAPSINLYLSALVQRTSTIAVGSLVHLLPFYEPMRLYEELCMLDHMSGGRLEFGFGKGVSPPEHFLWRIDRDEIEERTAECLHIILGAMRAYHEHGHGHLFSHHGRFWTYEEAPLEVGPLQAPFPPLWRPGTLDTAAEMGVSTIAPGPIATLAETLARYHQLSQPGVAPEQEPSIAVLRRVHLASTTAEADTRARVAWARFDANLTKLFRRYDVWPPHVPSFLGDYDKALATESLVVGDPSRVRDHFDEIASVPGVDEIVMCFSWGDIGGAEARRSLDLFAEHVMA